MQRSAASSNITSHLTLRILPCFIYLTFSKKQLCVLFRKHAWCGRSVFHQVWSWHREDPEPPLQHLPLAWMATIFV